MSITNGRYLQKLIAAASLALLIAGCSDVDSGDLKSSGFYASMNLTSTGNNQTDVRVFLRTSSKIDADEIVLTDGDVLEVTATGITKMLERDIGYGATFNFDGSLEEFVISLQRADDVDMPNSNVILPTKFSILMPNISDIFNSGESITVTWSPEVGSQQIEVSYSGDCVSVEDGANIHFGRGYVIDDVGTHTVFVDDILNVFGGHSEFDENITCPSTIMVERVNSGTIDPNYGKGGTITAKQIRSVKIGINP